MLTEKILLTDHKFYLQNMKFFIYINLLVFWITDQIFQFYDKDGWVCYISYKYVENASICLLSALGSTYGCTLII